MKTENQQNVIIFVIQTNTILNILAANFKTTFISGYKSAMGIGSQKINCDEILSA
jgi:hypothetical protein